MSSGFFSADGADGAIPEVDEVSVALIEWIKKRVRFKGFRKTMWNEEHDGIAVEFLTHPDARKMYAYMAVDGVLGLATAHNVSPVSPKQFTYFVRTEAGPLTLENIASKVSPFYPLLVFCCCLGAACAHHTHHYSFKNMF